MRATEASSSRPIPAPDAIRNTCSAAAASGRWKFPLSRHVLDDAKVLHEDIDCASRRVITVEHMGDAVFEHPGIASRPDNDLVDLAQVEALFCGKRYCLARCRDVHAGEKLIDHLERRAEADFRAWRVWGVGWLVVAQGAVATAKGPIACKSRAPHRVARGTTTRQSDERLLEILRQSLINRGLLSGNIIDQKHRRHRAPRLTGSALAV